MILDHLDFGYDVKSKAFTRFSYSFSTSKEDNDVVRAVRDAKDVMNILEHLLEQTYGGAGFIKEPKGEIGGHSSAIGVSYTPPLTFNPIARMRRGHGLASVEYKLPHDETGNIKDVNIWFYCADDKQPRLLQVHDSAIATPGLVLVDRVKTNLRRIEDLRHDGVSVERIFAPMLAAGK